MALRTITRWQEISPHLDEALALPEEQRPAWLATFRASHPELADLLEAFLEERRVLSEKNLLQKESGSALKPALLAGQVVGPYVLIEQIGRGGMGTVWLAERKDGRFERQVAVKFLNVGLFGAVIEERFRREGSILGRLAHPHIAELIDAGVSETGQPYLVLEYVDGEHIDRYCDELALEVKARVQLFLDVLDAVAHAHTNLIVHRDLKPSNVLVRKDGEVKLLDFGIAKLLEDERQAGVASQLTLEGGQVMTPEYASPEQLKGEAITTGTDVYSLGVLLYLLLTGQHPAGAGARSPADLVKAIVETEPTRASDTVMPQSPEALTAETASKRGTTADKLCRLLRGDLDNILAKALKKNLRERYSSVGAFGEDLRRYLQDEPISARRDKFSYRAAKFVRRNRTAVALTALAATATVAGAAGTLIQARTARAQRDFALRQMASTEALNQFHQFLLSEAAPSGKPFTVNELLRRAENIFQHQRAANDPDRVRIMISIGRQYMEQEEQSSASRVLEQAYQLSRGLSDLPVRAEASCTLAAALARGGDLSRAETLFKEGLNQLPKSPQFALERVDCWQAGLEIVIESGEMKEGVARAEAAQQELRNSPFDSDMLEMDRWQDLAKVYGSAGRGAEALAAFEHANGLLTSLGRDETGSAVSLFNNWALQLNLVGRPLEAEKLYKRAIDLSSAGPGEEAASPVVLNNYAGILRQLNRLDEAADYAERAFQSAQRSGNTLAINHGFLERAKIAGAQHKPNLANSLLDEVDANFRKTLPPGHFAFGIVASERALNALSAGDTPSALKLADASVALDEASIKAGAEGADYLPILLIRRATIELEAHRPELAATDATRVLTELRGGNSTANLSCYAGQADLILGQAFLAQGKRQEALAALRTALDNLTPTLGPDHPDTVRARQLVESLPHNR